MAHTPLVSTDPIIAANRYRVGVYGSLKKGQSNHAGYLKGFHSTGTAWVSGVMLHLGAFPMALEQHPEFPIKKEAYINVELYDVSGDVLLRLDSLEGHPDYYERRPRFSNAHGWFFVYYGHTHKYLKGRQSMVWDGKWEGPGTPTLQVDFFDGASKPKVLSILPTSATSKVSYLPVPAVVQPPAVAPTSIVLETKEIEVASNVEAWKSGTPAIIELI
jgi:gamma-glutamylcyclotransferase (GGCT)/AIG2-like uncharacterized protein YtfP